MYAAVAQLPVVQVRLLSPFAGNLRHSRHCLSFPLARLNLLEHHLRHVAFAVEIVVHLGLYEVAHVFVHAHSFGTHRQGADLDFRLAFEHRFLHVDGYCPDESVPDVGVFKVLAVEFLYRLGEMLLESTLVCTPLRGVLSVNE